MKLDSLDELQAGQRILEALPPMKSRQLVASPNLELRLQFHPRCILFQW